MNFDLNSILNVIVTADQVIVAAAAVAAIVPQASKAGPVLQAMRSVLDTIALNVANAKNAAPAPKS